MFRSILPLALLLVVAIPAYAQPAPLRVATYNILKYPTSDVNQRNGALRTVVAAMAPHVLVAQEVESAEGVRIFRDSVLDRVFEGRWEAAPFSDVSVDTEGAFFYDTTRVTYLGMEVVLTQLRGIFGYRFAVHGTTDTVWIYTVHLKASDGSSERAQRAEETRRLRNHLDSARAGQHVIVAGDFNVYGASEPALQTLYGEEGNADARLLDPLASTREWSDDPLSAPLHTQSPRRTQFGGGAPGGMDDRFDLILVSRSLTSIMDRGTYTAFGNDGKRLDSTITSPPNEAVPQHVAQAIHDASDHIPVYMDFNFGVSSAPMEIAATHTVVPNPASDVVRFDLAAPARGGVVRLHGAGGAEVARVMVEAGARSVTWNCGSVPSGVYTYVIDAMETPLTGTVTIVR